MTDTDPAVQALTPEEEVRRVIVEWLGPQRLSLYMARDLDRMVTGVMAYNAAIAARATPVDGGLRAALERVAAAKIEHPRDAADRRWNGFVNTVLATLRGSGHAAWREATPSEWDAARAAVLSRATHATSRTATHD